MRSLFTDTVIFVAFVRKQEVFFFASETIEIQGRINEIVIDVLDYVELGITDFF